jgi:superfamily II DNA or RNA helicase/predicted nucleic acid-binding Zn ribbon protein
MADLRTLPQLGIMSTKPLRQEARNTMPGRALRPYQVEAIDAIVEGLADGGSGQLHAACSSGKSLMAMRAAERLTGPAGLVVVLAPSLALVSQILDDWAEDSVHDYQRFAVCSDPSVHGQDDDESTGTAEIEKRAQVSTDPDVIAKWVTAEGPRLIVGTYASALRLADAVRQAGAEIDILICDEAHHLAGNADAHTRRIMDPAILPTVRRLYMTGTPRIGADRDETKTVRLLSMDDEAVFGPVFYNYPFSRGIAEGYLADYRIAVIGVSDQEVRKLVNRDDIEYVDGVGLRTAAAQVALARAYRDFGMRRAITFHGTIGDAQRFTETLPTTLASLPEDMRIATPTSLHVNGAMNSGLRGAALDTLRNPPEGGWAVLSNVRCLSEGVDVPALDGVLFGNPKRSTVDIVQAASRALRPHPDTPGLSTIIVPVIVPGEGDEVESIDPGAYEALFQILRALKEHDDILSAELNAARAAIKGTPGGDDVGATACGGGTDPIGTTGPGGDDCGRDGGHSAPAQRNPPHLSKVEFHGMTPGFLAEMRLVVLRRTTAQWWERYAEARAFHEKHGHLAVPSRLKRDALGAWIGHQRKDREKLSRSQVEALERLGMIWSVRDEAWERGYSAARQFFENHGHLLVPKDFVIDGFRLGTWIRTRRAEQRAGNLAPERKMLLDEMGMAWNPYDEAWDRAFDAAKTYRAQYGDLLVPNAYTVGGLRLGQWILMQRTGRRLGKLASERILLLDELGMIWNVSEEQWERGFRAAAAFRTQHGHLNVVRRYVFNDFHLGEWITDQRSKKRAGTLDPERERRLEALGIAWDPPVGFMPIGKSRDDCVICGTPISSSRPAGAKSCSEPCRRKLASNTRASTLALGSGPASRQERQCIACGGQIPESRNRGAKTCSKACMDTARRLNGMKGHAPRRTDSAEGLDKWAPEGDLAPRRPR